MPGFFDQPVNQYAPNPEPPETTLIRDMLARKAFDLQADPYGGAQMRPNSLQDAPAFAGSGGGPSSEYFYGSGGAGGSGGGNPGAPVAPRQSPLRAILQRLTRQMHPRPTAPDTPEGPMDNLQEGPGLSRSPSGDNIGSFFRAMQRFAPPRDSRGPLRQILRFSQMMGGGPMEAHDGANVDTGQLPGFDGERTLVGGHRDWWNATPWQGGWQNSGNGMPIGPGGAQYTGAGHEYSGFTGGGQAFADQRARINASRGGGGPSFSQWLREINKRSVMGRSPGMTGDDYEQQMAAIQARHSAANASAAAGRAQRPNILAQHQAAGRAR